jgi:TolA-binding protein
MIRITVKPDGSMTQTGTSSKSQYTSVAGIDGLRLEGGPNPSVRGMTKAAGVAAEFNAQLGQLDAKIAEERARIEELYEFDSVTGQRGFKKSADGTTRRAEELAKHIEGRIAALQFTRDGQVEIARHRLAEAHAADVAAASQPSEVEREIAARAEREQISADNEIRARHGLPPTGLKIG